MSASKDKPAVALHDLDRVALRQAITLNGVELAKGRIGTVVFCYGATAYEVEFDGIEDFFEIRSECLQKLG